MNSKDGLLETLAQSQAYRGYERAFGDATGLPLTLRTPDAWQVAQKDNSHQNPFCALMAGQSRSCAACLQVQQELSKQASNEPATYTCFAGLSDSAVPVKLGNQVIGFLQTGQVALRKPTAAGFNRVRAKLDELRIPGDRDAYEKVWMQSRHVSKRQYEGAVQLLASFAEQLSAASNQIAIHQANAEPPAITRAKAFIAEHLAEDLSLGDVSKAVNMSRFYFCKTFRKVTGLNFTDYVARLRVERAKELLLNPNLRVSEIAYEVGFQSLTHFNRVFRRIVGKAPTTYRGKLNVG
jgi:AraC-like DNA-binding protein/ligand-binding sensor protein